mmetsp:Transcript_19689/g.47000  ORF Transcript_19689/g.47000 Transcript_19689/m.47000 type:complete len:279 (+) Transcript_19689:71-907(+)
MSTSPETMPVAAREAELCTGCTSVVEDCFAAWDRLDLAEKQVSAGQWLVGPERCHRCQGEGLDCKRCQGLGSIQCPKCARGVECEYCGDSGRLFAPSVFRTCRVCVGLGRPHPRDYDCPCCKPPDRPCFECQGSGIVSVLRDSIYNERLSYYWKDCEQCSGSGEVKGRQCLQCDGEGQEKCASCNGAGCDSCDFWGYMSKTRRSLPDQNGSKLWTFGNSRECLNGRLTSHGHVYCSLQKMTDMLNEMSMQEMFPDDLVKPAASTAMRAAAQGQDDALI